MARPPARDLLWEPHELDLLNLFDVLRGAGFRQSEAPERDKPPFEIPCPPPDSDPVDPDEVSQPDPSARLLQRLTEGHFLDILGFLDDPRREVEGTRGSAAPSNNRESSLGILDEEDDFSEARRILYLSPEVHVALIPASNPPSDLPISPLEPSNLQVGRPLDVVSVERRLEFLSIVVSRQRASDSTRTDAMPRCPHPRFWDFETLIVPRPPRPCMRFDDRQWAGLLLFGGIAEFAIGLTIAEAVYPGYSVSRNYISDLGIGVASGIFNAAIILVGLAGFFSSRFLFLTFHDRILWILVALAGIGAIGVGIFTEDYPLVHSIFSLVTFLFAALAATYAFRFIRPPLGYLSIVLGVFSLAALGLFVSKTYLGLGPGGMERMIVWPVLVWGLAFGGYLLGTSAGSGETSTPGTST